MRAVVPATTAQYYHGAPDATTKLLLTPDVLLPDDVEDD